MSFNQCGHDPLKNRSEVNESGTIRSKKKTPNTSVTKGIFKIMQAKLGILLESFTGYVKTIRKYTLKQIFNFQS